MKQTVARAQVGVSCKERTEVPPPPAPAIFFTFSSRRIDQHGGGGGGGGGEINIQRESIKWVNKRIKQRIIKDIKFGEVD